MEADDIYRKRILSPSAYYALLDAMPHRRDGTRSPTQMNRYMCVQTMMNTGARYSELQAFGEHSEWFSARDKVIRLPGSSTKTGKARNVYLVPAFAEKLELYLSSNALKFPERHNMNKSLKGWYLMREQRMAQRNDQPPNCKTFRKTWVSYLLAMEYPLMKVSQSMGHTVAVCEHHYANLDPCLITEKELVRELTRGWMT